MKSFVVSTNKMVQSKFEYSSLKLDTISEQQINPKVLSVANSCHSKENSQNGKNRVSTNATPHDLPQQIPTSRAKNRCRGEEVVMAKLIAALARGLAGAVKISNLYPQASKLDI